MVCCKWQQGVVYKAQRPDPKIKGLHQYAERTGWTLGGNFFREVSDVYLADNKLVVVSSPDKLMTYTMGIFFAVFLSACIVVLANITAKKLRKPNSPLKGEFDANERRN
jgi:hypothetical protein